MLPPQVERALEADTVAINANLYAEAAGLSVEPGCYDAPAARLAEIYASLTDSQDVNVRQFAIENWVWRRSPVWDQRVAEAKDQSLIAPSFLCGDDPLTWRNWKAYERSHSGRAELADAFATLVDQSAVLAPVLARRIESERADFASHGLTPLETFAHREGMTGADLVALLRSIGLASRRPFQAALEKLSQAVFGRSAGPAELRALYLNRMYEPLAPLFHAGRPIADTVGALSEMGFDLRAIPVDTEDRPLKYPGAFCFPVRIPTDVRVSVAIATDHHLVDMLFHEFGHAAHFSGVNPHLSFVDRYWIHSGVHETFSTLFENLLDEPEFISAHLGLESGEVDRVIEFGQFKLLLTGAWLCASALTVAEAWLENLSWPQIEARYAEHMLAFSGVAIPPGFARLEPFVSALSNYPAGYVLASVRTYHWRQAMRRRERLPWWRSPDTAADIRAKMSLGGQMKFESAWNDPSALMTHLSHLPG